ncbi:hypothetical protein GDO78_017948 [Eleutherodactylus coqui]|uniref:NAD(P)(+)--arginine ADP-ribosyltransferase n=1 Tax=Eleutherodactylus coqui TaxID=57060 RepID=A0A8J6B7U4_ELECQ|nr:hypothetical protein GDO78_017948 [Eleutherodactylus coqui]
MESKLKEHGVLNIEHGKNKRLKRAWKEASDAWNHRKSDLQVQLPPGFEDNHGIALLTYTSFIRRDFNNAVKLAGKSYKSYMDDFGFKWLHFYVTSAFHLLSNSTVSGNYKVYIGIDNHIDVPANGSIHVKFGHFLYASLDKEEATLETNKSLLIIDRYPGVNIEHFSQVPSEREVLVPGFEVFSLSPTEEEDTFNLKTTRKFCSNFNCAYINGEKSQLSVHECLRAPASSGRAHGLLRSALFHSALLMGLLLIAVALLC